MTHTHVTDSAPSIESPPPLPDEWHYIDKGARNGPVSISTMHWLLEQGRIDARTQVWRKGMPEWVALRESELRGSLNAPPPLPAEAVNNSVAWLIACAPLILVIIQTEIHQPIPWFVHPIVNTALFLWDQHVLTRAGHSTRRSTFIAGFLLIPVYLFMRARNLGQRPTYAFAWIAFLVISVIAGQA